MILRSIIAFLWLSGFYLCVFSQAPGFAGKRFLVTTEGYTFPSIRFIFTDERDFVLYTHYGLKTEYVLNRRFSTGVLLNRIQNEVAYNFQGKRGVAAINGNSLGLHFKAYTFLRRGNIAPIGPYQKLEIQYLRYHLRDLDFQFYPDGREDLGSFRDWMVTLTLGFQHVLPPRITYHWGIQGGWILNVGQVFPFSEQGEYLSAITTTKLRDQFAISLNFGVGILLF